MVVGLWLVTLLWWCSACLVNFEVGGLWFCLFCLIVVWYWLFGVGFGCCGVFLLWFGGGVFWCFRVLMWLLVLWFYGGCCRSAARVSLAVPWRLSGVFALLVAS